MVYTSGTPSADGSTPGSGGESGEPLISIITPAFNEQDNLPVFHTRLQAVAGSLGITWEWVVVDDSHSSDDTWQVLRGCSDGSSASRDSVFTELWLAPRDCLRAAACRRSRRGGYGGRSAALP